jgi:hypothetical protein
MLVIVSDLHLTDGTTSASVPPASFHLFADRLWDLAFRASWRTDGRYQPIDSIDVLLLGDVLDIMRSARWLQTANRPWDGATNPETIETIVAVTSDILEHNQESLSVLRQLATDNTIGVPPADQAGHPVYNAQPQPVPVDIRYMVGNHDWPLHVPGDTYTLLRHEVGRFLGLAHDASRPFPHDPLECDDLLEMLRRHNVVARHGDVFDPISFNEERDRASLGDAIVIDLTLRFVRQLVDEMASDLPVAFLNALSEIDNVRPLPLVPVWLEGLLERTCHQTVVRKQVKRIWDQTVTRMIADDFVNEVCRTGPISIDSLVAALMIGSRAPGDWASSIRRWLCETRGAASESYGQHALAEPDFRNRRARHIVYGHTHIAESVPLEASSADGFVLNQLYFNAGTWRNVHRPTYFDSTAGEFIGAESLTYLSFFQGDERQGRPYESWSGFVGSTATEDHMRRVDPARANPVGRQHVQEPGTHIGVAAPHFSITPLPSQSAASRR